ncbi:MAG: hypothetical protein WAV28_11845, partial [Sedimentisphaerales bacterium]
MSIENPTLAHFRHFSSLFTYLPAYKAAVIYVPIRPYIYVPIRPYIYVPIRHYICRELSTNQPFLCKTNPILSAVGGLRMNVSIFLQMAYENKRDWTLGENKPK